ncbi:hypothetical protein JB92DRAFT_3119850 [Gautieria morchelliformis]|nr:hypothetical protein JB92DRAFT_3119850 [Gautieria morchelliformis]
MIKERREHVKADEEVFNTSIAADRAIQAANCKVQAQIDQNREQNAKGTKTLHQVKQGRRQTTSPWQGQVPHGYYSVRANKPLSHDDDPDMTSKTKTDDFYSPDPQDVAKQD